MDSSGYSGVVPILPTPFHADESLDLESLARLVTFHIEAGVDALTILGVLGEANTLTDDEARSVMSVAIATAGETPVIVGASRTGTQATLETAIEAANAGASAVMVAPPPSPGSPRWRSRSISAESPPSRRSP